MFDKVKRDYHLIEYFFDNPDGIHGVLHTKRVLLLSSILSYFEKIDEIDTDILAFCSLYHDIGRTHDEKCFKHGKRSVEIIDDNQLLENYTLETDVIWDDLDCEIALSIIENHCIGDKKGIESIMNNPKIEDKKRAVQLYKLFKDADALDRVRLKDLDINYLRTQGAKKLPIVAKQLLSFVK